jgi:cobalt/nickel transport system ATP-binding protein
VKSALEVIGLNFGFERNRPVLQDIDFRASDGECLGIVGGNGAGKSTLLWCLLGLLKASGSIRFFGEEISKRALARIAMVFQNPEDQLFMPSLLDDVALPLINRGLGISESRRMALDKLDKFGLGDLAGRPATRLSIGERKRASIAAALSTSPELLLLDEPTAELDGRSTRQLADVLAQLAVTTIVTSHHLDFLRRVTSRTLVLSKGRIIADGPTPDIFANQTLLQVADLV